MGLEEEERKRGGRSGRDSLNMTSMLNASKHSNVFLELEASGVARDSEDDDDHPRHESSEEAAFGGGSTSSEEEPQNIFETVGVNQPQKFILDKYASLGDAIGQKVLGQDNGPTRFKLGGR